MKLNLVGLLAFGAGLLFMYSAIHKLDPRDVMRSIFTGKANTLPVRTPQAQPNAPKPKGGK